MKPALVCLTLLLTGCAANKTPPDPSLWGKLKPGPYRAGYGLKWESDPTRRDPATKTKRILPVAVWYPARDSAAPPNQVGDYYELRTGQKEFEDPGAALNKLLRPPARDVMAKYTAATRDAPPAKGQYPVIIYSPGEDGAYSEEFILFEFLATHGLVVLSTPSAGDARGPDAMFLLHFANALGNVDPSRAAAMGRGAGADLVVAWAARPDTPLDLAIPIRTPADAEPERVLEKLRATFHP